MKTTNAVTLPLVLLFAAMFSLLGASPAFANTPTPAPVTTTQTTPAPLAATTISDDAARYAVREAKATKQVEYQGGDRVVIGITATTTAILLIVILLILL